MSTLSVATIKSQSTSAPAFQNSSGVEKGRLVSAWAHLDGISFHVQSSFNVSSATDHGSGDYQINFTNSFSSGDHYCCASQSRENDTGAIGEHNTYHQRVLSYTNASYYRLRTGTTSASADNKQVFFVIVGNN